MRRTPFRPGTAFAWRSSTSYWPIAWPSPEAGDVTVSTGSSRLRFRSSRATRGRRADAVRRRESAPPESRTTLRPGGFERSFAYDVATDTMTYTSIGDSGLQRIDAIGLELEEIARKVYRISSDDPLSADNVIHWTTSARREAFGGPGRDPHPHARDAASSS